MVKVTLLMPASSPSLASFSSTLKPRFSAQRRYMRSSISAQSWLSVPPAPGWMLTMASPASNSPVKSRCSSSASRTPPTSADSRFDVLRQFVGDHLVLGLLGGHVEQQLELVHLRGELLEVLELALQPAVTGAQLLGVVLVVPEVGGAHHLLEGSDVTRSTRRGQRYSLAHRSFSRIDAQKLAIFGQGGSLALSLLSHMQGGL